MSCMSEVVLEASALPWHAAQPSSPKLVLHCKECLPGSLHGGLKLPQLLRLA